MILDTVFTLLALYKPLHVVDTPDLTCGAWARLMEETVKVEVDTRRVRVNGMEWDFLGSDEDGDWVARFQTHPDQYMHLDLTFNTGGAYLSLAGIDAKRRLCKDTIYLKRLQ